MPQKDTDGKDAVPDPNEEVVIYDSNQRPTVWNVVRVLWCGCCEPTQHITTKFVKENSWKGCSRETKTLAMENIFDVRRQQSCCLVCLSGLPCCACCHDMGDLVLFVTDETERLSSGKHSHWLLVDVADSLTIHERITAHLQHLHADWRKTGRQMGRKLQQMDK